MTRWLVRAFWPAPYLRDNYLDLQADVIDRNARMTMHNIRKFSLLLVALAIGFLSANSARAQSVGNCEQAIGEAYLDINNVRARILNNGSLFYRGSPDVYEIPKGSGHKAIFASGIWMGGQVAGQLRVAGSTYGPYEFWAGPLNDDGTAPSDCDPYDRVWKISKDDVANYVNNGTSTPDLKDWPTGLGAPTLDANGESIDLTGQPLASRVDRKINLAAGERPDILGDQLLWWVMNDRGNQHTRTGSPPMGVEVHGSAFAFNTAGALGNTTFYKYRILYKGSVPLENTYLGIYSDPDLGAAFDDYVGSDTTLGMGFVYNADNDDDGNYGAAPPAAGYDFFQGPLVNDNGIDDNRNGEIDEDNERLKMTSFVYYSNGGAAIQSDPGNGQDMYNFMSGRWKDGTPLTYGGNGLGFSNIPTSFMYPGNPPAFWSEFNSDNQGSAIAPADRRFVMATGPFTVKPKDEQTLVFGIVTGFGADNIDSVRKMKSDDAVAQAAFDINFVVPSPPNAPRVTTTASNGSVLLEWGYNATDNNYLDSYNVIDPFCSETDCDYAFEGYKIYQYANPSDQDGVVIATYDVVNGVTKVVDSDGGDLLIVTADGTDSGVAHSHVVTSLTNYKNYEFGVQAYAYNFDSYPKAYHGPISRVNVIPQVTDKVIAPEAIAAARAGTALVGTGAETNVGNGGASARVVNAAAVTGHAYKVEFFTAETAGKRSDFILTNEPGDIDNDATLRNKLDAGKSGAATVVTYDVLDTTTGTKVFDGTKVAAQAGIAGPEGIDVLQFDGLSLDVAGAPNDILSFTIVANASGPIPETMGAFAFNSNGFPTFNGTDRVSSSSQTNGSTWGLHTGRSGTASPSFETFVSRALRNGWSDLVPYDFEMRFEPACHAEWEATKGVALAANPRPGLCYGYDRFSIIDGHSLQTIPFSVWRTGISSPDDASDDVRMIVAVIDWSADGWGIDPDDHPVSGGSDDPQTDWSYWYLPNDLSPGSGGYDAWLAGSIADATANSASHSRETFARMVFVNWNGGQVAGGVFDSDMPEAGTIFRIQTTKPNQPGDSFTFTTDGLGARARNEEEQKAALDNIGIVPNPYKGASSYEVTQLVDQVRFTNMPNQATIRIFTLAGTLIRTLEKNSAGAMFPWDLQTEDGLPVASGMYIIHVDVPNVGEKVLKFGVIKKRVQLNAF
jgi:hypothetical protein